jgi:hypothetical protein
LQAYPGKMQLFFRMQYYIFDMTDRPESGYQGSGVRRPGIEITADRTNTAVSPGSNRPEIARGEPGPEETSPKRDRQPKETRAQAVKEAGRPEGGFPPGTWLGRGKLGEGVPPAPLPPAELHPVRETIPALFRFIRNGLFAQSDVRRDAVGVCTPEHISTASSVHPRSPIAPSAQRMRWLGACDTTRQRPRRASASRAPRPTPGHLASDATL